LQATTTADRVRRHILWSSSVRTPVTRTVNYCTDITTSGGPIPMQLNSVEGSTGGQPPVNKRSS